LVKVSAAFKNKRIFSLTGWRASANGEIQHFNSRNRSTAAEEILNRSAAQPQSK
jgi:hypothetical protein